jgi:hypothetical protein
MVLEGLGMTNEKELHNSKVAGWVRSVALVCSIALLLDDDVSRGIEAALFHGLEKRTL